MSYVLMCPHKIVGGPDIARWPDGALRVTTYDPDEKYASPIKLQVHQSWDCVRGKLASGLCQKALSRGMKPCARILHWIVKRSRPELRSGAERRSNFLDSSCFHVLHVFMLPSNSLWHMKNQTCTSDWSQSLDVLRPVNCELHPWNDWQLA